MLSCNNDNGVKQLVYKERKSKVSG